MIKVLDAVKTAAEKFIDFMLVLLLGGIFVFGLCQVWWRWVLNNPLIWTEETIQLMYVWVCYLGWCLAERHDSHIRITALMNALPEKGQKWLQAFNHLLCIVFSVLMVYYGIKLVGMGANRTGISIKISMAVVYAMGPICNAVIIFYELAALVECFIKGPRSYKDAGGGDDALAEELKNVDVNELLGGGEDR